MAIGPIELLVVKFPGNQFKGEIAPALQELIDNGTIHVIDLLFAIKDENGTLAVLELNDLGDERLAVVAPQKSELSGALTEDEQEIFMVLFRKIARAGRSQVQQMASSA